MSVTQTRLCSSVLLVDLYMVDLSMRTLKASIGHASTTWGEKGVWSRQPSEGEPER